MDFNKINGVSEQYSLILEITELMGSGGMGPKQDP
jgi:hypothetical protein